MTELETEIVRLTRQGLSSTKIWGRMNGELTQHQVRAIAHKYVGPVVPGRRSDENAISAMIRPLVEQCLLTLGHDPYFCDVCEEPQLIPCDIHHTKYEGATIYDLVYACRSCNTSRVNKGLS
jgi:hypothetical protein